MNEAGVPLHFFVSYSREDGEAVDRLRRDLQGQGLPIWMDTAGLVPCTPNWETELRRALAGSYALIVAGSKSSAASTYVQAELALAQSLSLRVLPIWLRGQSWVEAVPLTLAKAQYFDLRGESYDVGLSALVRSLTQTILELKPRHRLVQDAHAGWYDHSQQSLGSGNPQYLTVQLDEPPYNRERDDRHRDERAVLFDPAAYSSTQKLLDDLYAGYLRNVYPPNTYGSQWILEERYRPYREPRESMPGITINPQRLLVPWEWLKVGATRPVCDYAPYWARAPLDTQDLGYSATWIVRSPEHTSRYGSSPLSSAFGIAVNNTSLLEEIMYGPGKQPHPPYKAGFLELVSFNDVEALSFANLVVAIDAWSGRPYAGSVLRETRLNFDATALTRWRSG